VTIKFRIATFNLENLDDKPNLKPSLDERIALLRPQLIRLNADILCLQEVNGQEEEGQPRRLLALDKLAEGTSYSNFNIVSTRIADGSQVYDERNLVILSRFDILSYKQSKHEYTREPRYQKVTETGNGDDGPEKITWERPILYAEIKLDDAHSLHIINLHLKSKRPSFIDGQKLDPYTWRSASGWAEGFFISSMKRVGQALETRFLVDKLFDEDGQALIAVCGDFNADLDEVPVEAIRGDVENTGNPKLAERIMVPCEKTIPESSRYSLFHHGIGKMIDHLIVSRGLLAYYKGTEIHNEVLHDESIAFATERKYPESDHAPIVAEFELS
jgi:endonuclease/exonuclease/phosphatase family metal-dependent hydrolase